MMKRLLGLFLSISLIIGTIFSLTSCDREYDEAEVISAAATLIERCVNLKINDIFFGEGIHYDPLESDLFYGNYKEADPDHLATLGFSDLSELEYISTTVYTKECYESVFKNTLKPSYDAAGNIVTFARYTERRNENTGEFISILVNVNHEGKVLEGSVEYHTSTLEIIDVEGEVIRLSVKATVTSPDGEKTQNRTVRFNMIETLDGWRLDSPIYVGYDENYSRYDELLEENENLFD